jgi:hypothetical protein
MIEAQTDSKVAVQASSSGIARRWWNLFLKAAQIVGFASNTLQITESAGDIFLTQQAGTDTPVYVGDVVNEEKSRG